MRCAIKWKTKHTRVRSHVMLIAFLSKPTLDVAKISTGAMCNKISIRSPSAYHVMLTSQPPGQQSLNRLRSRCATKLLSHSKSRAQYHMMLIAQPSKATFNTTVVSAMCNKTPVSRSLYHMMLIPPTSKLLSTSALMRCATKWKTLEGSIT
jgi:hypothetical protein